MSTGADQDAPPSPASDGPLAHAVLACAGVAALAAPVGDDDTELTVHVVARYGTPLREVGEQVGDALRDHLRGRRVHVFVDDVDATTTTSL